MFYFVQLEDTHMENVYPDFKLVLVKIIIFQLNGCQDLH